jgi:hypothetical protein
MEDVLDLYEEPYDSNKPLICFDEFDELPYQLVDEARVPLSPKPGQPARYDYEYERKGTTNLFAFFEPKRGFRRVEVSERRTAKDFALAMKRLVDELYPQAETIRLVLDNLKAPIPQRRSTERSSRPRRGE